MAFEKRRSYLFSAGIVLFLLALLTGLTIPFLANPRMGLSAHLVGLLGALFLIGMGVIWPEKDLPRRWDTVAFYFVIFGAYENLCTAFLAAVFATNSLTPLVGPAKSALPLYEGIVTAGLVSSNVVTAIACLLVLGGLHRRRAG